MQTSKTNTYPAVDAEDTNESLESEWESIAELDNGIDDPNNIANLTPTDVIANHTKVQDEDDLEADSITLTTTRRVISAEDKVMEEMEEDLDNETAQWKKDLAELGEELPEDDLDMAAYFTNTLCYAKYCDLQKNIGV